MKEQKELTYSEILEALRGGKDTQDLLSSEKIIVMRQLWERDSALPKRLEVVHSNHPSPRYAVGQKYEFGSGIYNSFLFDPIRQGYEVLLVHEVDGNLEWHVWHLKQYPIKR
jgi:hypothetical protein